VFNGDTSAPQNIPEAQYLPALQRQAELEKQLAEQQEQLRKFQAMQQQQQQQQQQFQSNPSYPMQQAPQNVPIMSANMASMPPMQQMQHIQPMPNIMGQNMPPNYYQNNNLALNMNALPINNINLLPEPNLPPNAMYSNVSINSHIGQNFMPAANPNLMMSNNSSQFSIGSQQKTFNMNANMNTSHLGTQNMNLYGQPSSSVYGLPQGNIPSMNNISSMPFQYSNTNPTYPVDDDAPSHAPPPPPPMPPAF
jgi:hypothetical protein